MRIQIAYLLLLLASMSGSQAKANILVWHSAEALTPNSYVEYQEPFYYLYLRCDHTLGDCKWRITTQLRIENGNSHDYSIWLRDTTGSATTLSVAQTSTVGSIYDVPTFIGENLPNGRISEIRGFHTGANIPSSSTVHFMNSFELTAGGTATSGQTTLHAGSYGFSGFEPADPGDPYRRVGIDGVCCVQFAGFPYEMSDDLIYINNVPEPASLSLLACGLVLVGRRKRQRT
jgi:hypothetical protein